MSDRVRALVCLSVILVGWGGVATWKRAQLDWVRDTCQEVEEAGEREWAVTYDCPDGSTVVMVGGR